MRSAPGRLLLMWSLLAALSVSAGWAQTPSWEELQAFYSYDAEMPLDAVADEIEDRGAFTVQTVRFASVNEETVPASLCMPKSEGKAPVILFLHGLGGSRADMVKIAAPLLCPTGIAIISIDAQYHGDRKVEGKQIFSADVESMGDGFRQTIIDNQRALDYVASRDDLDAERVVLIGASMGGIMGSIVAALDQRIDAAFLIVGGGDLAGLLAKSELDAVKQIREQIGDLEPLRASTAFIEPTNFVAHISPRPLQMVNGRNDKIVVAESGKALYDAAKQPKKITWYDGGSMNGHVPPLDVLFGQMRQFLSAQGFLPPVEP